MQSERQLFFEVLYNLIHYSYSLFKINYQLVKMNQMVKMIKMEVEQSAPNNLEKLSKKY
jgi:hypothetical protein